MSRLSLRGDLAGGDPAGGVRSIASERGAVVPYSLRALLDGALSTGAIWQGFKHRWEYNHRLNRFGSYVGPDGPGLVVGHAAASGSGPDTAHFEEHYTVVRSPGVRFEVGSVPVDVEGSEATRIEFHEPATHRLDAPLDEDETAWVVLNGFDLTAQADADKLAHLDVAVSGPTVAEDRDAVSFAVEGSFEAACRTPECNTGEDEVDYDLDVYYLLVRGDGDALSIADGDRVTNEYEWDVGGHDEEIHASDYSPVTATVDGVPAGPASTLAFESFSIDVEQRERDGVGHPALARAEAVHLLEWNTAIGDLDRRDDRLAGDVHLFFKNWTRGMKGVHPPQSRFALKDAGRARFEASLTLLRFDDPERHDADRRAGTLDWEGNEADPDTPDAVVEERIGNE